MKNIIITGTNGMIGKLVLEKLLNRSDVNRVTSISRKKSGIIHPKFIEVLHSDFSDFKNIKEHFKNQHICFYCLGVYTGQVSKEMFYKITVDFTKCFAEELKKNSEETAFCFLSGQGADSKEKSRIMFARIFPGMGVTSEKLATTMVDVAFRDTDKIFYENREIRLFNLLYSPQKISKQNHWAPVQ